METSSIHPDFTRIAAEYNVNLQTGLINSPGKFEGSPWSTIVFWERYLDGFVDDTLYLGDLPYSIFNLAPEDHGQLDIPPEYDYVVLWENEQGFVYADWMTADEFSFFEEELLAGDELDDEYAD